ncbi:MAG: hypothetical protein ABIP79_05565 [Chitinophagaceae bacterium]
MKSLSRILLVLFFLAGCTVSKVYPEKYYSENKELLHQTESIYRKASAKKTFALGFTSLDFSSISIELKTDTVRYIYDFPVEDQRMNDTLQKLGYDVGTIQAVITNMKKIKATWINTLDYYVDGNPQTLSFLSVPVKQFSLFPLMQKRKYYIYTFYNKLQAYDAVGRLLDKKNKRQLRRVNGQHFYRINDWVSYTISGKFR